MKLCKKLFGFVVEVKPITGKKKKEIQIAIELAENEIKEWKIFLKECKKKLNN